MPLERVFLTGETESSRTDGVPQCKDVRLGVFLWVIKRNVDLYLNWMRNGLAHG